MDYWESSLTKVGEILEAALHVQRGYMDLDNIFHAEDISIQLPKETEDFNKLTHEWKILSSGMAKALLIINACLEPCKKNKNILIV